MYRVIKSSEEISRSFFNKYGYEAVVTPNVNANVTMIYFYDSNGYRSKAAAKSFYEPRYKEGIVDDVDTSSGFVELSLDFNQTAEELNNFGYFEES